jgi:hypothetical protein
MKLNSPYLPRGLVALRRKGDARRFALNENASDFRLRAEKLSGQILDRTFDFGQINALSHRGKRVFMPHNYESVLVLRCMAREIQRAFGLQSQSREALVRTTIGLAQNRMEFCVYRFDIRQFFESLPRELIIKRVSANEKVSATTIWLLAALLNRKEFSRLRGLPRGLSLTSTLAEVWLLDLDERLRAVDSVFFYGRYVDDIIIFAAEEKATITATVSSELRRMRLQLNEAKSHKIVRDSDEKLTPPNTVLSYLGYNIDLSVAGDVTLTKQKLDRYKRRVLLAFFEFGQSKDYELLRNRLRFLASNIEISGADRRKGLYAGVYFSNQQLNGVKLIDLCSLDELVRKCVNCGKGRFAAAVSSLTQQEKRQLMKISFVAGHRDRVITKLSFKALREVTRVWAGV